MEPKPRRAEGKCHRPRRTASFDVNWLLRAAEFERSPGPPEYAALVRPDELVFGFGAVAIAARGRRDREYTLEFSPVAGVYRVLQ